ncbi:MAG TPA: NAD(P)/FAD-dependent oxidoreductase, partial [Bryobacterales bacterium]|nr:NAD(P)/FAD-dependent oxidoreductase [Bryobacterales bacterium]
MSKERLVVIGNGMAGVRTVEELLKLEGASRYAITIIGDEPYGNYNRILLSPVLAGENTIDDIILNTPEWYEENGIELIAGVAATGIDRAAREVELADGRRVPYNRLVIATGSRPFILPVPGNDLEGVIGFRDIADVETMIEAAEKYRHAVVIGGGLLGLEAANGLMKNGMDVTVVHLMDTLMERQLDRTAGEMLRRSLEERGMKFVMPAETTELVDDGSGRVKALRTKDGQEIPADLVVMAAGIKPNITLAKEAGIHCERGIVVNDYMMTYDPRIYAVGECVQHRGVTYGLVAPLYEQARVLANHLGGRGWMTYEGSVTSTKLKVTGIDLFSAGDFLGRPGCDEIVMHDPAGGTYKKLVLDGNRLTGAVLYGDTVDGSWYFQLIREETDISDIRGRLILGQAHLGDSGHGGDSAADMPDSMEVCGCNGVTKGEIVTAIKEQGLFTLEDVRAVTKASASCGSCTGLVEQILASVLGGDYSAAPSEKPMCGCTDYTHDQVRNAIRENGLKSIPEVMRFLEWRNPDGCASCRPALNYYLLCQWPGEYEDERASRFVNERLHGNIQKDGTYSVVPRMWGGLTTPKELRAIADVAEKYDIPEVKVTGGQRIDLFGVKKEDLPAVWRDLNAAGMVSGHAYGKALRTVKTCAGANWCRFGTQDSTGLGVKLEKMTWGSWMPHKFKFGVSGCPRNCAEATIKDFGVVCVDSGYELHVGGNGGIKVRVTDLIAKVETEEEVLEWAGAFIQLYREEARYLERTAPWIERVGLTHVKERLEDEKERKGLYDRFMFSQQFAQKDPWAELAEHE